MSAQRARSNYEMGAAEAAAAERQHIERNLEVAREAIAQHAKELQEESARAGSSSASSMNSLSLRESPTSPPAAPPRVLLAASLGQYGTCIQSRSETANRLAPSKQVPPVPPDPTASLA